MSSITLMVGVYVINKVYLGEKISESIGGKEYET